MGTRHLTAVFLDGSYKVAQYGQWDGYPSGQGADLLRLLEELDLDRLKAHCRACHFLSEEEYKQNWVECGANPDSPMVSMDISDRHSKRFPELSRDTGAKILQIIHNCPLGIGLSDRLSFAAESLFCEWAYVVDFDKGTLEIFKGFNHHPLTESDRFYFLQTAGAEYYPVKLVASWPLDALPSEEELCDTCDPEELSETTDC